jgi:hypothetical protein
MAVNRTLLSRIIAGTLLAFVLIAGAVAAGAVAAGDKDWGIVIKKKDIGSVGKFYPYTYKGIYMEIIAVRASDGTIRTALNTCQVCYDSGRGYYKQVGDVFVCQNCGNRFKVDQVEKIKGGCNPVPILPEYKTDLGDSIGITKELLAEAAPFFARWKR